MNGKDSDKLIPMDEGSLILSGQHDGSDYLDPTPNSVSDQEVVARPRKKRPYFRERKRYLTVEESRLDPFLFVVNTYSIGV